MAAGGTDPDLPFTTARCRKGRGGGRMGKFMPTAMQTGKLYVKSMTHWLCNTTVTRTIYIKHPSFTPSNLQPKEECAASYENQRVRGRPEFNLQQRQTGRETKLSRLNRHPDGIYVMADATQRTALIKSLVDREGMGVSYTATQ